MGRPRTDTCSGCGGERDRGPTQRYCRKCHAVYMREHRARHKVTPSNENPSPAVERKATIPA